MVKYNFEHLRFYDRDANMINGNSSMLKSLDEK